MKMSFRACVNGNGQVVVMEREVLATTRRSVTYRERFERVGSDLAARSEREGFGAWGASQKCGRLDWLRGEDTPEAALDALRDEALANAMRADEALKLSALVLAAFDRIAPSGARARQAKAHS
jgi:hypothetical protein